MSVTTVGSLPLRIAAATLAVLSIFGESISQASSAEINFERGILPLLKKHCIDCHGSDTAESGLRLDSPISALRGGDSGEPVIAVGNSRASHLIERVTSDDPDVRMPPDSQPLSKKQIDLLRAWIDENAAWKAAAAELASQRPSHWSFQKLSRPAVPAATGVNPIDAFIRARQRKAGLTASKRASRRRLIRRLSLVMHGLPPTPEDVQEFVGDQRDDAWERLVERVLASPRCGERFATPWLDLVRFGETHGFETNRERPHAWRYRDWVIDAFNQDKPYDEFVTEQLAGDALGSHVATGFLVAGPYDQVKGQDVQLQLMQRQDELADIINTTGTAFLGLTLGCARCHNHKFDPVTQTDYYALQAVFAGVNHADRALPPPDGTKQKLAGLDREIAALRHELARFVATKGTRPAVNAKQNIEVFPPVDAGFVRFTINATNQSPPCLDELEIFAGDENVALATAGATALSSGDFVHPRHKLEYINDGRYGNPRSWIPKQLSGGWVQIKLPKQRRIDRIVWGRDREGRYTDRLATDYRIETSVDGKQWNEVASSADRMPYSGDPPAEIEYDFEGFPTTETDSARKQLRRLNELSAQREALAKPTLAYAGTFRQPGPTYRLHRGEPNAPREEVAPAAIRSLTDLSLDKNASEQNRRLAIARWIGSDRNPLTARVLVNRIWQFHFGTGIVDTPSDFGRNGTRPTHPELLDWLAVEFIESGWSIKHIHRLILTSSTWQQNSHPRADAMSVDAGSRLLCRFPPRRLEAEGIRDSILAVSGRLNPRMGGPGYSAFEVELENVRHYFPKTDFGPDDWLRMIYMTKVRQERDSVFGVFDCPDCSQVVAQRIRSTTPLQALNLQNSRFVMQQAAFLVERLEREAGTPRERITRAYQLCFSRDPDQEEIAAAIEFVDETNLLQFARAMLNANEFVFIP